LIFFKCKGVEAAWGTYKDHLNTGPEDDAWREKKENLLAKLLYEMGCVLGFDIQAIDIFKGGYAPSGWAYRDARQGAVMEYVTQLAQGKNSVPISPYAPTQANPVPKLAPDGAVKKAAS
jgi:hypothetical protein